MRKQGNCGTLKTCTSSPGRLARKEAISKPIPHKVFVDGEGFLYLGRSYRLRLLPDDATTAASSLKKWQPKVAATVLDSTGSAVTGATVSGTFSHHKGTLTCVTAANGICTLGNFSLSRSTTSTVFTVTNVTKTASTYAPKANSDPDGDSNGTTITIKRP